MFLALLSLGRSAQHPAAVLSEIMRDARVDDGSHWNEIANILRFLVPVLLFVLGEHKGLQSEPENQQISSKQIHRKKQLFIDLK